ncbi:hypothetical protein J7J00_08815 [Bacillus sp. ISL-4]|uniref:hypothetical protein n=1 Tax=Bacillus sp. ISL-4 TaxID=2819125 RepID=UPI001BEABF8C|nr:hypothetical protein [Bacillus sp. ISL-4]MBT2665599.1 hypothetical protein [Bacillus sp. ISL-4]
MENITEIGGFSQLGWVMTAVSIVITVLKMFLLVDALARIQLIKNIRWLLVSILFIEMVLLKNLVGNTMVYQKLDNIWAVPPFSLSQAKFGFSIEGGGKILLLTSGLDDIVPRFMLAAGPKD